MMNVLCASHPLFLPLRICVLTMLLCSMTTTGLSVNVISCTLSNTSTWHGHLYVYMYVCIVVSVCVCVCMCVCSTAAWQVCLCAGGFLTLPIYVATL